MVAAPNKNPYMCPMIGKTLLDRKSYCIQLYNKLPIEKGRWDDTNRNLRICNLCNKNALGDEYHVLLECDFFATQRRLFIPRYYWNHCNSLKFSSLLSTNNTKLLKKLSDFVAIVLRMFK